MSTIKNSQEARDERLAAELREAAQAERPEFDEKLHVRIMEAVDPWRNPVAIYRDPPPSHLRRVVSSPWAAIAVAASVLIAVGLFAIEKSQPAEAEKVSGTVSVQARLLAVNLGPEKIPDTFSEPQIGPATLGTPNMMALAVTDPLKGFTVRTSQLPLAAAWRLEQLREANSRFAAEMVRDQLANLDQDARVAANLLFGTLPMGETPAEWPEAANQP